MNSELSLLILTAFSIGFFHTLLGPDHYIPFIAMSKAGNWSLRKTLAVTALAGFGHVLSSVILGMIGIALGVALNQLETIESYRGEIAAWLLISFGLVYTVWGIKNLIKGKSHSHWHYHSDGSFHKHSHSHQDEHAHVHEKQDKSNITPWILFTIFFFGPCEALIPILMYPAINVGTSGIVIVTIIFGITTIATMLIIVVSAIYGIGFFPLKRYEKYSHVLAGLIIAISGLSVQFLGL